MCLILFAYKQVPGIPLIALANRDEFYDRPTEPLHHWSNPADLIAGRDQQSGGTWLGVQPTGRWAAVTNYRAGMPTETFPASRGHIPLDFLRQSQPASEFMDALHAQRNAYAPFNSLLMDQSGLWHYCSALGTRTAVEPGVHGLSNHSLDTPWPKVVEGIWNLTRLLDDDFTSEELLRMMMDPTPAEDACLPETGVSLEWERKLSPVFISSDDYGTRSTTLLMMYASGRIELTERSYTENNPDGAFEDRTLVLND